jgi:hypothetical protein
MKYKYQLIILGSKAPEKIIIIASIIKKFSELNITKDFLKIIEASEIETEYKGNQPSFALYFGDVNGNFNDIETTKILLRNGTMILPIFFNEFSSDIPEILLNQNAIRYSKNEINRISNIVLESFELLRSTRKIFISYKRSESTAIAIQLFEALEACCFDVFLDTHSIQKGEPFQDELWHRMTDCDVIILLNTPKFLESHWCKEEFAEAGAKQIGIVQLVWPSHNLGSIENSSQISYPLQLNENNFIDGVYDDKGRFVEDFLKELIQKVESVRARNLAARQDNLITEFINIAVKNGRKVILQPERFLTENLDNGEHIIYIPTIGIPQSTSCQSAEIRKELMGFKDVSIRLIYDDLRIRDNWLNHLDWLNDNFKKDIKTLKKQDFESWLQKK